jgi:hypothetical protein
MDTDQEAAWGTSCTPGRVVSGAFSELDSPALFLVRLDLSGIAGDAVRLRELILAVQILRRAGLLVSYELDLFGGSPRFATIRDNLAILRAIVADGTTAAMFTVGPASGQCSPWVDEYRDRVRAAVEPWLSGLSDQLAHAWAEVVMGERVIRGLNGVAAHRIALQRLTLRSNTELLNLVADSAREFELTGESRLLDDDIVGPRISLLTESMLALRNRFVAAQATAIADATARLAARATARLTAPARLDASAGALVQAAKDVVPLRRVG